MFPCVPGGLRRRLRYSVEMEPLPSSVLDDPSLAATEEVTAALGTDAQDGLSSDEAAARLRRIGPNRLEAARTIPAWRKLLAQFADPLVYLLLAAIVVSRRLRTATSWRPCPPTSSTGTTRRTRWTRCHGCTS